MKIKVVIFTAVTLAAAQASAHQDEKKGVTTQTAAEAKAREGRTGTSNINAAKQMEEIKRQEDNNAPPTTVPQPKTTPDPASNNGGRP